jgi:hypothetical protein
MNSSALYNDRGYPSGLVGENDYAPLAGPVSCPAECLTNYAIPGSNTSCPSACGFYDEYSSIGAITSGGGMYIPAATRARLIQTPALTENSIVYNPRINTFSGNVESAADVLKESVQKMANSTQQAMTTMATAPAAAAPQVQQAIQDANTVQQVINSLPAEVQASPVVQDVAQQAQTVQQEGFRFLNSMGSMYY